MDGREFMAMNLKDDLVVQATFAIQYGEGREYGAVCLEPNLPPGTFTVAEWTEGCSPSRLGA